MERRYKLLARGYDLDKIAERVSKVMELEMSEIWAPGKERKRVAARSLLCYWSVRNVGISMAELSRQLNLSPSGVSLAVKRGEQIARERNYFLHSTAVKLQN